MPSLRRCAPTARPDGRGTGGQMSVDWVAGWRGIRTGGAGVLFQQISSTLFGVSLAGRLGNPYAWPQADSH